MACGCAIFMPAPSFVSDLLFASFASEQTTCLENPSTGGFHGAIFTSFNSLKSLSWDFSEFKLDLLCFLPKFIRSREHP
jgi:hypothetical protein